MAMLSDETRFAIWRDQMVVWSQDAESVAVDKYAVRTAVALFDAALDGGITTEATDETLAALLIDDASALTSSQRRDLLLRVAAARGL